METEKMIIEETTSLIPIETITERTLPKEWDYNESVIKVRGNILKMKYLKVETLRELWIAHNMLSSQGKRTDLNLVRNQTKLKTFKEYCEDCEISRDTAYRFLKMYDPEFDRMRTKKEIEEEKKERKRIEKYRKLKENEYKNKNIYSEISQLGNNILGFESEIKTTEAIIGTLKDYYYDLKEDDYLIISEESSQEVQQVYLAPEIKRHISHLLQKMNSCKEQLEQFQDEYFSEMDREKLENLKDEGYSINYIKIKKEEPSE